MIGDKNALDEKIIKERNALREAFDTESLDLTKRFVWRISYSQFKIWITGWAFKSKFQVLSEFIRELNEPMRTLERVQPFFTSFEFWDFFHGFSLSYVVLWRGL